MVSLAQLWLPILLSAVFVFIASSILHMVLKFWHTPDYRGFSNEDEVGAAIRKGGASRGMYIIPYCGQEAMKNPATQEKFKQGPVGMVFLRTSGPVNMGTYLGQWFVFCLVVSLLASCLAGSMMSTGAPYWRVFHVVAITSSMTYALGSLPDAYGGGHPWGSTIKNIIDGLIYALITAATFAWFWPR